MMISAFSKFVHHGSSCCRGLDQYYCLPQNQQDHSVESNGDPYIGPSHIWYLDLAAHHQSYDEHPKQPVRRKDSRSRVDGKNSEEHPPHSSVKDLPIHDPDDAVDRVDHYTQLVPEALVNTENEISYMTSIENERNEENDMTYEPNDMYPKYEMFSL